MAHSIQMEERALSTSLERPVLVSGEMLTWIGIVVATLVTRLWNLGQRAMSHDESLHTFYSWKLFVGQGYVHDPMMHGPLLYHATALFYALFGVNDATARLLAVVTGLLLVVSPLLVRKWLGPVGAAAAGILLLMSPTVMYYSRYIRHDIPVELFTVLMFVGFIRYLDKQEGRWIVVAAAAAAGAITSAEMSYINGFVLLAYIAVVLLVERLGRRLGEMVLMILGATGVGLLVFGLIAHTGELGDVTPGAEGSPGLRLAMQVSFLFGGLALIYAFAGFYTAYLETKSPAPKESADDVPGTLGHLLPESLFARLSSAPLYGLGHLVAGAVAATAALVLGPILDSRAMEVGTSQPAGRMLELLAAAMPVVTWLGVGVAYLGVGALLHRADRPRLYLWLHLVGGLIATAGAALLVKTIGVQPPQVTLCLGCFVDNPDLATFTLSRDMCMAVFVVGFVVLVHAFLGWTLSRPDERRLARRLAVAPAASLGVAVAVFAVIYVLLFTTFFTQPQRLGGFFHSIYYWLEQQDVKRGGQPWFYYSILTPMYEFMPMWLSLIGSMVYVFRTKLRVMRGNDDDVDNPSPAARYFIPMLVAWIGGNFWIYSWAGEKMPWLTVHLVVPMAILGGRVLADLVDGLNAAEFRRQGWKAAGLGLLLVAASIAWMHAATTSDQPVRAWLLGLPVLFILTWGLLRVAAHLTSGQLRTIVALSVAGVMFLFNVRTALVANFVNDEVATEYIVYAHGTPDDKLVYNTLRDMQTRAGVENPLSVAYDNDVSWPFTWYFRSTDWHNAMYVEKNPDSARNADVVLVGEGNYSIFHPYLRDRFVWVDYQRMLWPNEGYKQLTWDGLVENIVNPNLRRNWINILLYRKYTADPRADDPQPKPLTQWYHQSKMRMYVKRDLVTKLWPEFQGRPEWLAQGAEPFVDVSVDLPVDLRLTTAAADTPIVGPKDVAVGPDGRIYVVSGGNSLVMVFEEDGTFVTSFGAAELRDNAGGGSAWGVAVADDGTVFVADTWNHRIVRFRDGRMLSSWGTYGTGTSGTEFFGPRDIAIGFDGNLYVTDTGNSRIMVFTQAGQPVRTLGGKGIEAGMFSEPVGIAVDPATGDFFVADLWNYRVQRFDRQFNPVAQWIVDGWDSNQAADDKAYIAVGPGSTVVVTDPQGSRVTVYSNTGTLLATLDVIMDSEGLEKPIGVAVDPTGRIYVSSHGRGVVTRYSPLPAMLEALGPAEPGDEGDADASDSAEEGDAETDDAAGEPVDAEPTGEDGANANESPDADVAPAATATGPDPTGGP